ncbi:alpha/beta hydrolase [Kibdelosporangium aridum]|uniref:Alpha/beta hydrolase fold n=1 Tax=Kibdelosporangium aridum TaxID=2030 RepID=A0A1W2FMT4_KIBAR|nr:alpha/beta hydrolase [Kibdelosporangium aridum]SMD23251.1 alpha/beta hydrolase fold [Kibdelosporangium aridum]
MRPLILALGALIVGTLVTPTTASAAPAWAPCPDGLALECTTVSVPLDYRKPNGTKIDIAVSRKKAADPATRRGILLLNPGGPGGPGLDMPLLVDQVAPQRLKDAYDLIGFDPRGTGRSTPNTCALTPEQLDGSKVIPYPAANGDISESVAYARQVAKQCFEHSGDRLPYVTTANTARDMDQIRAALGEKKISYFGGSYGSYLGAVYTTLFPQQSDRIVLDSVVDPRGIWRGVWQNWGAAVEERFEDFAKWAAERDSTYGLGATPRAVRATYFELTAKLDAQPIEGITGNVLRGVTRGGLYADQVFPTIAELWQAVKRGEAGPIVNFPITQGFAATLWGIACGDASWPRHTGLYQWQVLADRKKYPLTNGMPSNVWPCTFWPSKPIEPAVRITDRGPRNVLLTQNLRDPATPLVGARNMRTALGDRAKLVTADQGGHGTYLTTDNACVNEIGTEFLVNGTLPAKDVHCGPPARSLSATDARAEVARKLWQRQFPF